MGLSTFFSFTGSILQKILKVLCLISWGVGGIVYAYGFYNAIFNMMTFPGGTKIVTASWLLHLSLRFFALWVPMGFCLIHWQMKSIWVLVGYAAGCALAILFSFVSFIFILGYTKDDELRKEYIDLVQAELKSKKFPTSVKALISSQKCCSWFGPTDFAPKSLFDIEKNIETDLDFMSDVALCYGGTFTVSKDPDGNLLYMPKDEKNRAIPKGCAEILADTATMAANFIFFTSIAIIILTLAITALYVLNYLKMPSPKVQSETQRNKSMEPSEEPTSTDVIEEPLEGPSDTLSAAPSGS